MCQNLEALEKDCFSLSGLQRNFSTQIGLARGMRNGVAADWKPERGQ